MQGTDEQEEPPLTDDERAAIRAYLQRSEVRLSTMHRVATALLSGAGLMVLLPAVERDSVVDVVRALLTDNLDAAHLLLVAAVGMSLALPFTALWFVLRDLTQFYFHANHLSHAGGEAFTPRFTLTGLRLPRDELGEVASSALTEARHDPRTIELLVPNNDSARARIDQRVDVYGGLGVGPVRDDISRASAMFELAASRPRTLLNEVAKVEHGMTRHVLRTQTIVLRYVKALLALLTTALAAFAAAAVVDGKADLHAGDEVWLAGIFLAWAPLVIVAVTSPVRWLEDQLRNEGATHTAVAGDQELTQVETVTVRLALAGFVAAAAAMVVVLPRDALTTNTRAGGVVVLVASVLLLALVYRSWRSPRRIFRT